MVRRHPARSCLRETDLSISWHCEQSFCVSALPGPSGSGLSTLADDLIHSPPANSVRATPSKATRHMRLLRRQTREEITTALIESMLHRETERVDHAVVRRQINLAHAARQRGAASKRRDRRPAVPNLFAGLAVERVEDCARRTPRPLRRSHLTIVSTKLAAGGYKDHAVDDRGRQRRNQVARCPGGLQRQRAVLLNKFPGDDRAICHGAVRGREPEISGLRAHSRREYPARAASILPTRQRARRRSPRFQ